jgi:hypothetical protein
VKCLRKCEENKNVVVYVGVVKREENDDELMLEIKEGVVVDIGGGFD